MNEKGTLAEKGILLEYLQKAAKLDFHKVMFTYPEPLPNFPVGSNYIGRMLVVLDGQMEIFSSNGSKINFRELNAGEVLFTAEHCWAGVQTEDYSIETISIIFMNEYTRFVAVNAKNGEIIRNPYYHTFAPPNDKALGILKALNLTIYDSTPETEIKACHLLKALLLDSIEELREDEPQFISKAEESYKTIRDYIDHNYQMPINRNDICYDLGFNPCYVSRLFKKYYGDKINNYLEKCRMEKAQNMLKKYNIRIAQVARQCGYSSESYFRKAFKKYFGVTPGVFRLTHK
jgi:AraC-like DNA-binding protein